MLILGVILEWARRVVLSRATPDPDEINKVNTNNKELLEHLCVRKSKLDWIIFVCACSFLGDIAKFNKESQTNLTKGLFAAGMTSDALTIIFMLNSREKWYKNLTFTLGLAAFIANSAKLLVMFVPYAFVLLPLDDNLAVDLEFLAKTVFPWYVPYLIIFLMFKSNSYYLIKISDKAFDTWKVLELIYIPINIALYSVVMNLFAFYIIIFKLDRALISIVYILWILGVASVVMSGFNPKISSILSWTWVLIAVITLYIINETLYSWLVQFVISSAITGIKLNTICKDVLCYTFEIEPKNSPLSDLEMSISRN